MTEPEHQHEPFIKSDRELLIDQLSKLAHDGDKEAQKALLQHIEGDQFFSTEAGVKIILLNGPPRSGKDTATDFAMNHLGNKGQRYRFAAPLKNTIHAMFGFAGVQEEHFTHVKDQPNPEMFAAFDPPTWRQAYIWLSEKVVKPKFGHDFWSRVAVTSIKQMKKPVVVISDCGFVEEAQVLVQAFGKGNVAIVHLYREGCSFEGLKDSRSYIDGVDCAKFEVVNNGTVHDLYESMVTVIESFTNAK